MIYLLDTDTLIYMIRGFKLTAPKDPRQKQRHEVANRIAARCRRRQEEGDEIGLSAITVAELEYGAWHSGDYAKEILAVQKILAPFSRFDFSASECAAHYGEARHALESSGSSIGAMDLLIASHSRALGASLVTNNTSEFSRIPGLKCENWAE